MKAVVCIDWVTRQPTIKHVPDDWRECSVTGDMFPPEDFMRDGQDYISRTNSTLSYEMPSSKMNEVRDQTAAIKMSKEYIALMRTFSRECDLVAHSITVADMIAALQKLSPNDRLLVTQDGYYADGDLASIYTPEAFGVPGYYTIGHSSQNY